MDWTDIRANAAGDLRRGWRVSFEDMMIAALVMLPFTFAVTLLLNAIVWLPSAVLIVLAAIVQGFGMFWNAGWRARTAPGGDE